MPNVWTHILFCEEVVDAVNQPFLTTENESFLKLGAQGPDPFYYINFWPWKKNKALADAGKVMHTEKCGNFLMDLLTEAKTKKRSVQAFVVGFLTHHILDRNTHPYIHYHAGYEGRNHQKLEVTIDTLMMEKYHHIKTWKTQVYKEIDIGRNLNTEILELLHKTMNKHYPRLKSTTYYINKAYKDMMLALKLLSDPYGWKHIVLNSFVTPYSHQPIKDEKDYLNLNHRTWYHSATKESSNLSFIDLYNQSRIEAIEILTELGHFWENNHNEVYAKQRLEELIGNISYDTGKPLSIHTQNQYCDPIV
ncbi:zinc dependent phospholipase C family protein [Oceanobacillus senegalensis]|uniref:zinc dependent phospholipase C family protein n=1 Tax=Oceanobacillus senegalensis TaxID=1936063 RepID=UPI000A310B48|nr:zinc dependent phospholipase C family protein [Oceanobacillus senegalensis]